MAVTSSPAPTPKSIPGSSAESAPPSRVMELEARLAALEEERERIARRHRRHLAIVGISLSLVVHLGIMLYLAMMTRGASGGGGNAPVSYEFAILDDEQLTEFEPVEFEDVSPEALTDLQESSPDLSELMTPEASSVELDLAAAGALPALGGAGDSDTGAEGISGGGAGASFFGVSSAGTRFAYIVDISASMGQGQRLDVAMRELSRSIQGLPDYAHFYIVLYSTVYQTPPMQKGWTRARPTAVGPIVRWLTTVDPTGGTEPVPAFHQVFSLEVRPDVIFFLTDGEIPLYTGAEVSGLNKRGRKVVVNTISFGEVASQDLLKQIASESGGVYRHVPAGTN